VGAGTHASSTPIGARRHDPAAMLALFGGGVLLVEAVLAVLLLGFDAEASSTTRTALRLGIGGLVALGAAQLVPATPRLAALLCLVAAVPAAFAQLPLFASRLHALYWGPSFSPGQPTLAEALAPLLGWLLAAAPLICAAFLAWHRSAHARGGVAR
jgi:hypothetical protein